MSQAVTQLKSSLGTIKCSFFQLYILHDLDCKCEVCEENMYSFDTPEKVTIFLFCPAFL